MRQVAQTVALEGAAQQRGISERTVRRHIKAGTVAAYKQETPRREVWRIFLPGTPADLNLPAWRQSDQDGGNMPGSAALVDMTPSAAAAPATGVGQARSQDRAGAGRLRMRTPERGLHCHRYGTSLGCHPLRQG